MHATNLDLHPLIGHLRGVSAKKTDQIRQGRGGRGEQLLISIVRMEYISGSSQDGCGILQKQYDSSAVSEVNVVVINRAIRCLTYPGYPGDQMTHHCSC